MPEHLPANEELQFLVAGFNAFGQLCPHHLDDIRDFYPTLISQGLESVRVLFTCWSSTVLVVGSRLVALGFQQFVHILNDATARSLKDGFGDHNGMIGCIDTAGRLYLLATDGGVRNGALQCQSDASSPRISNLALAANGRVAAVLQQGLTAPSFEIAKFETLEHFTKWFHNPTAVVQRQVFTLPGSPKKLLAGIATFLLLLESGEVYSWGDPRYQSLGRPIVGGNASPADKPAALESLGGLQIMKIACGGWMGAALSEDRALYIWGTSLPGGEDPTIRPLCEADVGEAVLVEILLPNGEPMDVFDVGVGNNHIVLIGENGDLWGIGANRGGQLGLSSVEHFADDWTLLRQSGVTSVTCGPKCTIALTSQPNG